MDINTNPYELGLGRLVDLTMEAKFIGKAALTRIQAEGVKKLLVGTAIAGAPMETPNTEHWPLFNDAEQVGVITSAVYSPRLERNIALAMVASSCAGLGTTLEVRGAIGNRLVTVVEKPFFDPKKSLPKASTMR